MRDLALMTYEGGRLKHVLVIDDDSTIRQLLIDYLSQHALKVSAVSDSHQMTRVLSTEIIDLVIVDLNLGHEDGLEIVRNLATSPMRRSSSSAAIGWRRQTRSSAWNLGRRTTSSNRSVCANYWLACERRCGKGLSSRLRKTENPICLMAGASI